MPSKWIASLSRAPVLAQDNASSASTGRAGQEAGGTNHSEPMALTSDILTTICIDHAESQDLSLPLIQHIEDITKEQSSCDLWMALHRGRITSYSFHDVLVRKDSTPPDNLVKRWMSYEVFRGSAATEHGKRHEDNARRTYRSYMNYVGHTGLTVQPSGLTLHDTMSFLGASADGFVHVP